MNTKSIGLATAAALLACCIVVAQTGVAKMTKDPFPNGCVSCHTKLPDGRDLRLPAALKMVPGHPNVASIVKTVPADCKKCHAGDSRALSMVVHKMHFGKGDKSEFVQKFGGSCVACHRFNPKTNRMDVKTGTKNW